MFFLLDIKGDDSCKMLEISSTSNVKYKYIKSLLTKKSRMKNREYTVEGIKSVHDAIKSGQTLSMIAVSKSFFEENKFLYPQDTEVLIADDSIFAGLCDTLTPQGIIAVIKMKDTGEFKFNGESFVYCDNVQDPGNLGTIIRTAEAAGMSAVLLSPECVDIYSPKVVRASMGSYFNIDIIPNVGHDKLYDMKKNGMNIIGGSLRDNTIDYRSADYSKPVMLVLGNEANGISDEVLDLCQSVKIPIYGKAESLNVSVAAGILIYEIFRNRG